MSEIEHYMQAVSRLRSDVEFLLTLVPEWARTEPPANVPPMFYGTLSRAGDLEIVNRVRAIKASLK